MKNEINPRIFLTDYASYNAGKQFEYGHWVDLDIFSDHDEFMEYVKKHFKKANKESPDIFREEIMITDYEDFPSELYDESGSHIELIFVWMNLEEYEKHQFEYSIWNHGLSSANNFADVCLYHDDVEDIFHELYPGTDDLPDYCYVNYDAFERDCLTSFDCLDGTRVYVYE